ncbi:MAG: bifunctional oligoribonuclease/PAP phosphatase NrnA [Candidatus Coprovivens sp.]
MKYIILGHENPDVDSIVSGYLLEKVLIKKGYDVEFVIPDKEISKDSEMLCNKYNLFIGKYKKELLKEKCKYILVDHNKREVFGDIIAIIDHHPSDELDVKYVKIESASSTACMIAQEFEELLGKKDIELACMATFVDTASFHSTKTRKSDINWINDMCTKYHFDYDQMYRDGLCLTDLKNVDEIIFNGIKKYDFSGYVLHSSFIQINDIKMVDSIMDEVLNKLKKYVIDEKVDMYVFIVYDMSSFYTKVYRIDKYDVDTDEYYLYASRGNTIIPDIVKKYINN